MYQPPNQQPPWQPQPHTDLPSQPQWQQPPTQYPPYQQQSQYYPPPPPYYQPPPVMMVQPPQPNRSLWWLWLIVGIIVALLGMCTCGYVVSASQRHSTTSSSVQTQSTVAQQTGTWTTIQTFRGNGQKKTSVFTVPDHWRLKWKCNPASDYFGSYNVIIDVYNSDGTPLDIAVINTICQHGNTSGGTEEYQGGDVYLDLQIDGAYTVTVQMLQ